ncbi:MAG: patatin-like phospholipase family protein [Bacteroidales bacterium]
MKKIITVGLFVVIAALILTFRGQRINTEPVPHDVTVRKGTAIIMTGAAARIPQETALLEELYNRGLLKDVVFISGVSSGALNAVALNGVLSGKMTWDEYRTILFGLRNSDVFTQVGKKLPVNTTPLRSFLKEMVENKLGYKTMGDLPYMTAISFTDTKNLDLKKIVYRICSRKINPETDTTLSVVDVLMASTAFPIAFPPVHIHNATTIPDDEYVDGGVGEDHVPYHALLEFEKFRGMGVEKVFILSRKSDSIPAVSEELKILGINDRGLFDRMGISIDNILKKGIIKRLKAFAEDAPELIPRTYVYIPDFPENFLMFNFDKLEEQYKLTANWAKHHDPVVLGNYLLPYLLRRSDEFELEPREK